MGIPKTPRAQNMWLNKYLWGVTKEKFNQFCAHCTLHGIYYFSNKSRWWLRSLWVIMVFCSLALCCFLSHMIWDKFVIDPTLTVVETTHYSTADIPFPAVTVCDTEMVHGPNTDNITDLLILRGYNRSQISEFYQSFSDIRNKNYTPTAYVRKMHYLLDDLGFPLKKLLGMFKKPCGEILVECNWRSRPHNCSEMFRPVYTIIGHCCQFDIPFFKKHASSETNFIAGVQTTEALDLTVSPAKVSNDGTVADGNVMLYVFDQKDRVTLTDNAIVLTPKAYFDVNVYLWAIDSSIYVKALSLQSRKCILDSDPGIGTSFYQGCMTRLILRKVVDQCRCLPFEFSAKELDVEDYATCTWDRLICVYQAIEMVEADVRDIISQSECYQRCDYVQYETEVEFVKLQRSSSLKNLRLLSENTGKEFHSSIVRRINVEPICFVYTLWEIKEINSKVTIHFSETTCMKYRREVLYTWDQMLANLGGIFGLCLGGSIVSIMELVWFIFDLIFTVLHEAYKKKKVEPKAEQIKKNKNNIFIINHNIPMQANKIYKTSRKDLNANKLGRSSSGVRYKFVN